MPSSTTASSTPRLVNGAALAYALLASSPLFAGPPAHELQETPLELLLQQQTHYWATVPSVTGPAFLEAADDLQLDADVHRVRFLGNSCFSCTPGQLQAATLRFYSDAGGEPGALLRQEILLPGNPALIASEGPELIDITLNPPLTVSGTVWASVQLDVVGPWAWWISNFNQPNGAPFRVRDSADGAWVPYQSSYTYDLVADLALEVYGLDDTPLTGGSDPCGTWDPVPSPAVGQDVLFMDVAASSSTEVWAVGREITGTFGNSDTHNYVERWDGTNWTEVPTPRPEPYPGGGYSALEAVAIDESGAVWAAGGARVVGPDGFVGTQVHVQRWSGSDWEVLAAPATSGGSGNFVDDIEVLGENEVWFVGDWLRFEPGSPGIQASLAMRWDGSSFSVFDTPQFDNSGGYGGGHGLTSISALDPDDIWAVGGAHDGDFTPHSYILHFDGSSWSHIPGPTPGIDQRLYAVEAIAPDDVWASGFYTQIEGFLLIKVPLFLHWDGSDWTQVASPGGGSTLVQRVGGDLISSSGTYGVEGIYRYDGTQWTQVMSFPSTPNVQARGLVESAPCEVWAVGRMNGPNAGGMHAHLTPAAAQAVAQVREPCFVPSPQQSLSVSPPPAIGKSISVAVDDPSDSAGIAPGAAVLLAFAPGVLDPANPCGTLLPGFGAGGGPGELLLSPGSSGLKLVGPAIWTGPEQPALLDVPIPAWTALVGQQFASQAVWIDPTQALVVLTRAVDLQLGG